MHVTLLLAALIMNAEKITLFEASSPTAVRSQIVNDDVMGGVSSSRFVLETNGIAVFQGTVSLENNGGFASVRLQPLKRNLAGCKEFVLRIRGDGRLYKFIVRTDEGLDGINYQAAFTTTNGVWQEHRLPLSEFAPTYRGRVLRDQPPLDPSRIATIGFLISDKQAGPFRLQVAWIKAST